MTVDVRCEVQAIRVWAERGLREHGIKLDRHADWCIVIDAPVGWAPLMLANLNPARALVVSENSCPEYQIGLLALQIAELISQQSVGSLASIINQVFKGHVIHPTTSSKLSPKEQLTLRLIAEGYPVEVCAQKRRVTERALRNTLSSIYTKLNLNSRVQLTHYYYGDWHLLTRYHGWRPQD